MKRYYFRIYQGDDDGSNVWTEANSWEQARNEIESEYHSINKIIELYER